MSNDLKMFKKVVEKQLGNDIFSFKTERERTSTSSLKLDDFIGGGLVRGRIMEIFAGESAGKSTVASLLATSFQKTYPDKAVGILDVEHVWNHEYAQAYGLNYSEDRLVFVQPNSAEESLTLAEKMLESGLFSLVILDSVPAMLTKKQLSGDIGDQTIGELARLMSVSLPKINRAASNTNTDMLFINQIRDNIGTFSPMGASTTTPGGKALKFYSSLRLELKRRDFIAGSGDTAPIGQIIRVFIKKNKFGRNYGNIDLNLYYNVGFIPEDEIVDLALEHNIIEQRGAWAYFGDLKWNGKKMLTDAIKQDKALFLKIYNAYLDVMNKKVRSISIEVIPDNPTSEEIEAEDDD